MHNNGWEDRVHHEEKHPANGNVFIHSDWNGTIFHTYWRQDRRHVWDVRKISLLGYDTLDEALKNLPQDISNFTPPEKYVGCHIRDSQKNRVYKWERVHLIKIRSLRKRLRRTEMFAFFHHVCTELDLEKDLTLTTNNRSDHPFYAHYKRTVNVPEIWSKSFFTKETILHELAHHLADTNYDKLEIQSHGPEFMKEYIFLLTRFSRVGQKRLVESLTKSRIKFDLYQETSDDTQDSTQG